MILDKNRFGVIEKVEIRDEWKHEANDFTPWLATDESIRILSEAIGIDIEVQGTEVPIGSFIADIVGKTEDGRKIIIENQLAKTDHKHLGQIITYASGIDAKIIIWLCQEVTEEHRRAIDWLNDYTTSEIAVFACEIQLWKIDDSRRALKFEVVSSPNDWSKTIKTQPNEIISPTKQLQLDFWNGFKEYMTDQETDLRMRTPKPQHWFTIPLGTSCFTLSLTANTQLNRIGCEVYLGGKRANQIFPLLLNIKEDIEVELGPLEWMALPDKTACRIIVYEDGDIKDKAQWPDLFQWLGERAQVFKETFLPKVSYIENELKKLAQNYSS